MLNLRAVLVVACVGALAACGSAESAEPDLSHADIANIKNLRSDFPAPFKVTDIAPTAIDPRVLEPQKLPAQIKFEPADCAKFANQQVLPAGVKGNMAALTAEGEGNRFIVIAVETSETVPVNGPPENCQKVGFTGPGHARPHRGRRCAEDRRRCRRRVLTGSSRPRSAESPVPASFTTMSPDSARFMVIVTANPLVIPDKPVAPVDTKRAGELLSAGVAAVKA